MTAAAALVTQTAQGMMVGNLSMINSPETPGLFDDPNDWQPPIMSPEQK